MTTTTAPTRHLVAAPECYDDERPGARRALLAAARRHLRIKGALQVEGVRRGAADGWEVMLTTGTPDARVWAVRQPLAHSVGPAAHARVAAMAARTGQTLVAWRPHDHEAILHPTPALDIAVRGAIATSMRCDAHDVRVWVEHDEGGYVVGVHVTRAPAALRETLAAAALEAVRDLRLDVREHTEWRAAAADGGPLTLVSAVDPLRGLAAYPADAVPTMTSIPLGNLEDGSPLALGLLETNALIGGTPGGGKSGGITAILRGVSQLEHVALVGLDPKRVEQRGWATRFTQIVTDPDAALATLEKLEAEMLRRYSWIANQKGKKKLSTADFTTSMPLIVVIIDELADLVSGGVEKEEKARETAITSKIRRLVALGRAAGFVIVTATQKPLAEIIPTSLRDLIQQRVAYATTTPAMTETILGSGMAQMGGLSHEISGGPMRGVCYVVHESSRTPVRARTYWIPDEDVEGHAEATAHLRVPLPWLTGEAVPAVVAPDDGPEVVHLAPITLTLDDLTDADPLADWSTDLT